MAEFVKIGRTGDIPEGTGKAYEVGDHWIAVFNLSGQFHAIDNACPHRGASLAGGPVEGSRVTCPWHGWEFDIPTGKMWKSDGVRTHPVKIEGDEIWVALEE